MTHHIRYIGRLHIVRFFVGLLVGLIAVSAIDAPEAAAHGFWDNCNTDTDYSLSSWNRSSARSYSYVARYEGYHWYGGCWNNNNIDDQPGDPVKTASTHGEGGDCSGFTFKSWALVDNETSTGYRYWPQLRNIHGAFTASEFKAGDGPNLSQISKASTIYMDALASSSHIGMIYSTTSTWNTDNIIEAKGEADGTGLWVRTYRGDSSFTGVRRWGGCLWDGTCS